MLRTLSQFHGTHLSLDWHLLFVLHRIFGSWLCIRAGHVSYLASATTLRLRRVWLLSRPTPATSSRMECPCQASCCGITLKHYAYHTMSRRTQRATKYIFPVLSQLSGNFIFIYLGLSLFTSPPSSEKVTNYVKSLFIAITVVAVVFTRYAAVFPLSEAINFFYRHARGQQNEELPHSYQMMLFWAGLRGAVGVAVAAGFKGPNAQTLRTTVLIVVVLTVILFGGTSARMLEILGIRTGVEDEDASSSEEEDGGRLLGGDGWNHRSTRLSGLGRWRPYFDDEPSYLTPRRQTFPRGDPARVGAHYALYNHQHGHAQMINPGALFSAASSESYESDGEEVLPMALTTSAGGGG